MPKNIFLLTCIVSVIILAAIGLAFIMRQQGAVAPSTTNNSTQQGMRETGPGLPVRLSIPSIKVDANIIYLGLASDGSVDTPKGPYEVSWFKLGVRPGQEGSAILTGHYGPWQTGAKSVFDNLHTLKKGDKIYIEDDQRKTLIFIVRETRTYGANESPKEVFNSESGAHLNLITCSGTWLKDQQTYTQRLVVFTDLASS